MAEHTALPWSLCNEGKCACLQISGEHHPIAKVFSGKWGDNYPAIRIQEGHGSIEGKYEVYMEQITYGEISEETAQANAAFIVRAANCYERLIGAIESLKEHADLFDAFRDEIGKAVLSEVNAALKEAKGA